MRRKRFIAVGVVLAIVAAYFVAMIPDRVPSIATKGRGDVFMWNQDAHWHTLENKFVTQKGNGYKRSTQSRLALGKTLSRLSTTGFPRIFGPWDVLCRNTATQKSVQRNYLLPNENCSSTKKVSFG